MSDFYKDTRQDSVWRDFADMIDALSTTGDASYQKERENIAYHVEALNAAIPQAKNSKSLENLDTIIDGLKVQTSGNFPALNTLVNVLGDGVENRKSAYNLYTNTLNSDNTQQFINLYDEITQNYDITTKDMIENTTGFWTYENLTKLMYEYNLISANIQQGIDSGFSSAEDVETRTKLDSISNVLNTGIMALTTGGHILPSEAKLVLMGDVKSMELLTKGKQDYYRNAIKTNNSTLGGLASQIQIVTNQIIEGGEESPVYLEPGGPAELSFQSIYNNTADLLVNGELNETTIFTYATNPLTPNIEMDSSKDNYLQLTETLDVYMNRIFEDVNSQKRATYLENLTNSQLYFGSIGTDLEKNAKQWGYGGTQDIDIDNYYKDRNTIQRLTNPLYDNDLRTEVTYNLFDNNATLINELFITENNTIKPNPKHLKVTKGFVEGKQAEFYEYVDSSGQKHYLDKNALNNFTTKFSDADKIYKSEEFSDKKEIIDSAGDLFDGDINLAKLYLYDIEKIKFSDKKVNSKLNDLSKKGDFNLNLNDYIITNLKTAATLTEENIKNSIDNAKTDEERSKGQMLLKLKQYININNIDIEKINSINIDDIQTFVLFN
tara:strand:+ start:6375 stop:8195 length:1821 start_codon:yes stop_codon:yes gene_type:complete